ncbi:MAG TPA: adenosine nucleotide hydrolase [Rubrivivax sp.]|nr:adenosine nucleotide hydrolase [Rubrivivax sp.]
MTRKAAISWSAGKDSCLAWLRARESGFEVATFVTMCEPDGTSKSHALSPALVQAQVAAAGGTWWPVCVPPQRYAECFDATLARLRASGHGHVVFGDIDLQAHRDWLEPACARAGLQAVFPLWREQRAALAREVIDRGIRATLVVVDTRWLDAGFAGAAYDDALLARLPAGVCPCGEGGEFHTFVHDAPAFAAALQLRPGTPQRVASRPPMAATELVLCAPVLACEA